MEVVGIMKKVNLKSDEATNRQVRRPETTDRRTTDKMVDRHFYTHHLKTKHILPYTA
jgi:hypothetical protein